MLCFSKARLSSLLYLFITQCDVISQETEFMPVGTRPLRVANGYFSCHHKSLNFIGIPWSLPVCNVLLVVVKEAIAWKITWSKCESETRFKFNGQRYRMQITSLKQPYLNSTVINTQDFFKLVKNVCSNWQRIYIQQNEPFKRRDGCEFTLGLNNSTV